MSRKSKNVQIKSSAIVFVKWQQGFSFVSCLLHQSAPSLFLKSNFEYLRGNYRKAVKLLNSSNIAEHPGPIKTGDKCFTSSLHEGKRAVQAALDWLGLTQLISVLTPTSVVLCDTVCACFVSFRWMCSMYVLEQPGMHTLCNGEA